MSTFKETMNEIENGENQELEFSIKLEKNEEGKNAVKAKMKGDKKKLGILFCETFLEDPSFFTFLKKIIGSFESTLELHNATKGDEKLFKLLVDLLVNVQNNSSKSE